MRAIENSHLIDKAVIIERASNDPDSSVREAAIERVESSEELVEIQKKEKEENVIREGIKKVTDEKLLDDIALNARSTTARHYAIEKLSNKDVIFNTLLNCDDDSLCESAARKICSTPELSEIARNAKGFCARIDAVRFSSDPVMLADMAKSDSEKLIREAAVRKLTDEVILKDIYKNEKDVTLRRATIEGITDQTFLTEILEENNYSYSTIIGNLVDPAILKRLIGSTEDMERRKMLVDRLKILDSIFIKRILVDRDGAPMNDSSVYLFETAGNSLAFEYGPPSLNGRLEIRSPSCKTDKSGKFEIVLSPEYLKNVKEVNSFTVGLIDQDRPIRCKTPDGDLLFFKIEPSISNEIILRKVLFEK